MADYHRVIHRSVFKNCLKMFKMVYFCLKVKKTWFLIKNDYLCVNIIARPTIYAIKEKDLTLLFEFRSRTLSKITRGFFILKFINDRNI